MKRAGTVAVLLIGMLVILALAMPKRRGIIVDRARGKVQVARGCSVLSPGIFDSEQRFAENVSKVHELKRDGALTLYDTPIGTVWYRTGAWTLPALVEENQEDEYRWKTNVKPGDVVLDVGANVGTDTKSALAAGAGTVVAIEPEPVTLECLRRNLANEIASKKVIVVPKGAWDRDDTLTLHVDTANGGGSSFFWGGGPTVQVPLTTIDRMVADLNLPKVDVIKMDIEGSEKNALLGARETIRRFHPRLALVLEHHVDDVDVLPKVARELWPGYQVTLTECTKTFNLIHPAVALLH